MDIIYKVNKLDDGTINIIYSFLGMHPVAKIIEHNIIEKFFDKLDNELKLINQFLVERKLNNKLYKEYLDIYCAFMFGNE